MALRGRGRGVRRAKEEPKRSLALLEADEQEPKLFEQFSNCVYESPMTQEGSSHRQMEPPSSKAHICVACQARVVEVVGLRDSLSEAQEHFLEAREQMTEAREELVASRDEVARLECGFDALAVRLSEAGTTLARERLLRLQAEAEQARLLAHISEAEAEQARLSVRLGEAGHTHEAVREVAVREQVLAEVEAVRAEAAAAVAVAKGQMATQVGAAQAEAAQAREKAAVATAAAVVATAEMQAAEEEAKAARETTATAAAVVDQATRKMQAAQAAAAAARQAEVVASTGLPRAAVAETAVQAGVRAELARVRVGLVARAEEARAGMTAARAETVEARAEVVEVQEQLAAAVADVHTHFHEQLHQGLGLRERTAWSRYTSPPSRPKWRPAGFSPAKERRPQARPTLQPHLSRGRSKSEAALHASFRHAAPSRIDGGTRTTPRAKRPTHWSASPRPGAQREPPRATLAQWHGD